MLEVLGVIVGVEVEDWINIRGKVRLVDDELGAVEDCIRLPAVIGLADGDDVAIGALLLGLSKGDKLVIG
jgi:hypothetical protein